MGLVHIFILLGLAEHSGLAQDNHSTSRSCQTVKMALSAINTVAETILWTEIHGAATSHRSKRTML